MSSEFNGSYEDYLNSPLDTGLVNGEPSENNAPFVYRYGDNFPLLDIEPATETVDPKALELWQHPFQKEHTSADADESGFEPKELMLQDTGSDVEAPYEIDQSDYQPLPQLIGGFQPQSYVTTSANEDPVPRDPESLRCPWMNCSMVLSSHFKEDIKSHFNDHRFPYKPLFREWSPSTTCNWSKCSSKAVFKTPSSYVTHLENIHISPLVCEVPECSYAKPFSKRCDLVRHISTAHGDGGQVECPIQGCDTKARKDKLQEHMRKYHQKLRCPYSHCNATVIEGQEEAHIRDGHGPYECGLGACEAGLQSRFLVNRLQRHARTQHGVEPYLFFSLKLIMDKSPDKTLRADMFWKSRRSKKDCKECLAKRVQD